MNNHASMLVNNKRCNNYQLHNFKLNMSDTMSSKKNLKQMLIDIEGNSIPCSYSSVDCLRFSIHVSTLCHIL